VPFDIRLYLANSHSLLEEILLPDKKERSQNCDQSPYRTALTSDLIGGLLAEGCQHLSNEEFYLQAVLLMVKEMVREDLEQFHEYHS
jgi:hypothetical protein